MSRISKFGLQFLCALCVLAALPFVSEAAAPSSWDHHWVKAFNLSDEGEPLWHEGQGMKHYPFLDTGHIYGQVRRTSPDGCYEAVIVCGDGEVGYVYVFRRHPGRHYPHRADLVSQKITDVRGCVWVPGHGHWLAISAGGGDCEPGLMTLWDRPYRVHALRRRLPLGYGYDIQAVSSDGHLLRYTYLTNDDRPSLLLSLPRQ